MANYKNLDYLADIKNSNVMTEGDLIDALQNIAYVLNDNGFEDARFFIEDIIDGIENNEIDI